MKQDLTNLKCLLIGVFVLLSIPAFSYERRDNQEYGASFGVGFNKLHGYNGFAFRKGATQSKNIAPMFEAGAFYRYTFDEGLFFQPELNLSVTSTKIGEQYSDIWTNIYRRSVEVYAGIRLYSGLKISLPQERAIIIGVGPYAKFNVNEWARDSEDEDQAPKEKPDGSFLYEHRPTRADIGLSIMLAYSWRRSQISVAYDHGLTPIIKDEYPIKNRGLKLSYSFFY